MACGTFVHHIITLLLLVATTLLIVSVTAPAVSSLAILRVDLGGSIQGNEITFGSFGYCHRDVLDADQCSRSHIDYNPADFISDIDGTDFSSAAENTSKVLTRVMILHPVAAGLCFLAFLLCLGTGVVGSLGANFFALVAFVVTIVAIAYDFVVFGIVRGHINDYGGGTARWSSGIWCILAAALVILTCCASWAKKHREAARAKEADNVNGDTSAPLPALLEARLRGGGGQDSVAGGWAHSSPRDRSWN